MRLRLAPAFMIIASACAATAAHADQERSVPDFRVDTWAYIAADFSARVSDYASLRSDLEKDLRPLTVTGDVAAIRRRQRALAKRIRAARHGARQGDIFTPAITAQLRAAIVLATNAHTWAAVMDDNPGDFSTHINGVYPERKPRSAVPPSILTALPPLPHDIQYRFLGQHLVLLDTKANVILDRMPFAIQLTRCFQRQCGGRQR